MDVANEILDAIEIIVDKKIKEQTTQIYPGICKSVNGNSCVMSINGKDNTVQFYGSAPIVGTIYRVFVPYGNMSMAFIITANDNGSSASGVSSVNGLTGDVNLIASDVGAAPAGYGLGTDSTEITDFNAALTNGFFKSGLDSVNGPFDDFIGLVFVHSSYAGNTHMVRQDAYRRLSGCPEHYVRYCIGGTWKEWEYENPPMLLGIEYRTTERYQGKPVYCKLVDFGKLPNNTYKDVAHGISNLQYAIFVSGESNGDNLIGNMYITYVNIGSTNIRIKTNADRSGVDATVLIKYTKTTD